MKHLAASFLCIAYLALAPLCVSPAGHSAVQNNSAHQHHATESAPLPLSYHTEMYQSFTTAHVAISMILIGVVLALYPHAGTAPLPQPRVVHRMTPGRSDEHPPNRLLQRLSLLAHAPPLAAYA